MSFIAMAAAGLLMLTLPVWLFTLRSQNSLMRLAGLIFYGVLAYGVSLGICFAAGLQVNYDTGFAFMKQLDAMISQIESGQLLSVSMPVERDSIFLARKVFLWAWGIGLGGTAAFLALLPYKKYEWILFLAVPLWACFAFSWNGIADDRFNADQLKNNTLSRIVTAIGTARKRGIPDSLILGNLRESRALYRFTYENMRTGRKSMESTLKAIESMPPRAGFQRAREVLKTVQVCCGPEPGKNGRKYPGRAAFEMMLEDARKNGVEDAVRLLYSAQVPEGKLYALAILYAVDYRRFRRESQFCSAEGKAWLRAGVTVQEVPLKDFVDHPELFERPPFSLKPALVK